MFKALKKLICGEPSPNVCPGRGSNTLKCEFTTKSIEKECCFFFNDMIWSPQNCDFKFYCKSNDRWYFETKNGNYFTCERHVEHRYYDETDADGFQINIHEIITSFEDFSPICVETFKEKLAESDINMFIEHYGEYPTA